MMICAKCLVDLRPEKNGVLVARDRYHVQHADLMKCPECGLEILAHAGAPARLELAEKYYNNKAGRWRGLYRLDSKEILPPEVVTKE